MPFLSPDKTFARLIRQCFFIGVLATTAAFADVAILGSWVNGTTHTAETGSNRALLVFVFGEDADVFSATGITYGGQAMTKLLDEDQTSGVPDYTTYAGAWILNEAGIAAASSSTIAVTWSQTPDQGSTVLSVFLSGVNQTTLSGDESQNGNDDITTITTNSSLANSAGDMAIFGGACQNKSGYTVNNSFSEAWDGMDSLAWGSVVAGYKSCTGANETPSVTKGVSTRQTIIGFVVNASSTVSFTKRVAASSDDAEQTGAGATADINSNDLEIRAASAYTGMRFNNVTIPKGSTINTAYLDLEAFSTYATATVGTFYGEDADDAATFAALANNITNRTKTTASVSWNPISNFTSGTVYSSPSLVTIISEITDRASWASGNDLVILFEYASGADRREISSYDGDAANAPYLVVEYSTRRVWDGGGGSGTWTTAANWVGDAQSPSGGEDIVFAGSTQTSVNHNQTAATSYNSFTFASGASAFTLSGNSITLGGDITNSSSNLQTISANLALSGNRAVMANSANITLSGVISGSSYGLAKSGTATLTLSGTNTYTGATTVSVGTLKAGIATAAFGSNSAVTTANTANTSLDITGYNNTIGSLSGGGATGGNVILGAATLTTGGLNTSTTYTGVISGTGGGLTKAGTGTFTLSGTNTYTGATTVSVGTLKAGIATAAFGSNSAVTTANTANTSLDITGYSNTIGSLSGGGSTGGNLILSNTATLTTGGDNTSTTYAGVISGTGGALTKTGSGTLTLSGTSTYTGLTTINNGVLKLGAAGNATNTPLGTTTAGTVVNSGGTLDLNGWDLGTAEPLTLNGQGYGSLGALRNTGGGAAIYSGLLTLGSASTINMNNGALTLSNTGTITGSGFNLTLDCATGSNGTINSIIGTGAGGVIKTGTGTFILTGTNTYTGTTTISTGTLKLQGGAFPGAARTWSIASGAVLNLDGTTDVADGTTTINGAGTLQITGGILENTISFSHGITMAMSSGGLIDVQSGAEMTNGGWSSVSWGSNLADLTVSGEFDVWDGNDVYVDALSGSGTVTKEISVQHPIVSLIVGVDNGSGTFSGIISNASGTTNITKRGTGTQTFSGTNTYTGATTVSLGTLKAGIITSAFGSNSALTLTNSASTSLDITGYSNTIGSLSGGGTTGGTLILANTATLTTGGLNTSTTFAGVISGTGGALIKTGSGTFTLTNTQTYTGATTISAGTLQIGDGTTDGSIATSSGITDNAALIYNVVGSRTYANIISGTGTFTKTGAGTLTLSATNTLTGLVTVNAGTLSLATTNSPSGAFGSASGITINSGGTITVTTNALVGYTVLITPTITINSGGVLTSAGTTNCHLSAVSLNGGTLSATSENTTWGNWNFDYGVSTPGGGVTSTISGGNAALTQTGGTVFNIGSGDVVNMSTILAHTVSAKDSGLIKSGAGTLTLSGTNTYTSVTTVSLGTLKAGIITSAFGSNSALTLTNSASTSLDLNNYSNTIGSLSGGGATGGNVLLGSATLTTGGLNTSTTYTGVISGTGGGLTKTGTGTFTLSGTNTYTGATTVSVGTLKAGVATAAFGSNSAVSIADVANTSLDMTGYSNTIGSLSGGGATGGNLILSNTATLTTGGNNTSTTYAGVISGTGGALTKTGSGTLTLTGTNTYTGTTTISVGTLKLQGGAFPGAARTYTIASGAVLNIDGNTSPPSGTTTINGAGTLRITGGTLSGASDGLDIALSMSSGGLIDVQSGATLVNGGWQGTTWTGNLADLNVDGTFNIHDGNIVIIDALTGSGAVTKEYSGTHTLSLGWDNGSGTFSGIIRNASGSTAITKRGTGTQTFSGTNTYTGATTVNLGTLKAGIITSAFGSNSALTLTNSASTSLDLNNFSNTIGSLSGGGATGGNVLLGSGTLTTGGDNTSTTYTGVVSGTGGITKNGSGTQTLSGTNTYTGATTINVGTLKAGIATAAFGSNSAVSIADAANTSLDITGYSNTIGSLSGGGSTGGTLILANTATLTTGGNNTSTTFAGVISGTGGALTKTGSGTLTLSGTSTYTGATTVSNGTLLVTGATNSNSAVAVNSGGTLAGTGTVAGTVAVNNGGIAAPGTGGTTIGTLRTGALTFSSTSTYSVDLNADTPTFDSVYSTGTVTCAGTLTIASLGGTPATAKVYKIIQATSVTGTFTGLADNAIFTSNGRYFQIDYTGTQVTLTDCAVPTTYVWDGGGTDNNWNTALNWSTDLAPSATHHLQFAGGTRLTPSNNYAAATSFGSLTFNSGASAFTLSGTSITLTGGVTNSSSNLQTISLDMAMAATRDFAASSANITVSGILSGAGGLTKSGTATLTLSGTNTYTGATTVTLGTLKAGIITSAFGSNSALTLTNSASTSLDITTYNNTIGSLSGGGATGGNVILGAATLTTGGNNTSTTYTGVVSGTGGLTKTGTGTFTLSGTNTYTGATTVSLGTLKAGIITSAFGSNSALTLTNSASTSLDITGYSNTIGSLSGGGTTGGNLILSNTATLTTGGDNSSTTYAGVISGTGGALVKTGSGAFTLTGTNTYTGGTTLSAGTLNINNASAIGTGTFTINGGTIDNTSTGDITLSTNNAQVWGGNFTYLGGSWSLNLGTGAVPLTADRTVMVSGDTLTVGGAVTGNYTITKAGAGNLTLSGTTDNNSLRVTVNAGTVNLAKTSASNVHAVGWGLTVAGGTVYLGGTNGDQIFNNGDVTINSGTFDMKGLSETINELTGSGGYVNNSGGGTSTLTIGNYNNNATYSGIIQNTSGTLALTKIGTATQTLSGTNTYTGATTVSVGTLKAGIATAAFGSNSAVTTANTASTSLDITDYNNTIGSLSGGGATGGNVILGAAVLTTGGDNTSTTYTGVVSGTGGLTKTGTGTFTLSGTNTYTGATTVTLGTLKAGIITSAFGSNSALTLTNSASTSLDITGFNNTIGSLSGGGTTGGDVILTGNTLTTGGDNTSTTYAGVLSGASGALTKTGSGTQTLSGTSTYTGATTVSNGTLLVTGATNASSAVGVSSGATLGGTGTVAGAITVNNGGTLAPGTGGTTIGTLTTGAVTFSTTSTYSVDLDGTTPTYDQINSTGIVALGSAVNTLTVASLANSSSGDVYTIINATTSVTGTFAGKPEGSTFEVSGRTLVINYTSNTVTLTDAPGIAIIGSWVNGATHTAETGSNRALIVFLYGEHTAEFSATGVTYGTKAMTRIVERGGQVGGNYSYTSAWYLNEADIAAASSSTIEVTWSVSPSQGNSVESVFLSNVYQASPIGGTASNFNNSTATITTDALTNSSGDMAFVAGTGENDNSYTVNNGFTETWEYSGSGYDAVAGYKAATGANETPSLTSSVTQRQTIIGFIVKCNATAYIWDGGGADDNWNTALNWSTDLAPSATNNLQFAGATRLTPSNNYAAATSFGSITFNSGASAFTLSGTSITLGGSITNSSSNLQTISLDMALSGGRTIATNSGNVTVSGVLSGSYGLNKSGAGYTLTLSGTNTYTGSTMVLEGTLKAGVATAAFGSNSAIITANVAGTSLDITGYSNTIGSLYGGGAAGGNVILGAATLTTGGDNTDTRYWGVISGTGGLTKAGSSSTFTLSGTNTYTGATTVNNGTLTAAIATQAYGSNSAVTLANANNTRIDLDGFSNTIGSLSGGGTTGGNVSLDAGTLTTGGDNTSTTYAGVIAGTGGLTKTGSGTFTLTGTNTYTGTTTISVGTLKLQGGAFPGAARTYSIASGAVLNIDGNTNVASGTSTINGAGTLLITGGTFKNTTSTGRDITLSMSSGGLIDVQSGAEFTNGGWSAISWGSNLADLNVGGEFNVWDGNDVYVDALSGSGTVTKEISNINPIVSLIAGVDNGSGTFSGVISNASGTINFTKRGTGTQTFSGTNTYTGTTTVNLGTLKAGIITSAFGSNSALTLTNSASTSLDLNNFSNTIGSLTGGGGTGGNVLLGSATLTTGGLNTSTTYTGVVSGTGGLTKTGTGTFTLSGTNTYTGATTVSLGTLKAGVITAAFGSNSALTLTNSASTSLDITGFDNTIGSLSGGGTTGGNVILGTAILTTGGNNTSTTYAGVISGTGALTKTGSGTFTLTNTQTYTGVTTITTGTLQIGDGTTDGSIATSSGITDNAALIYNIVGSRTYANVIGGTGTLTKTGAGTLTLSGTNTYSGGTTLTTGTLNINHAAAIGTGAFTINGGTIDNTSAGDITLSNNNTQTWGGNFTFPGTRNLNMGTGTVTLTGGRTVTVSGSTLTIDGGISGTYTLTKEGAGALTLSGTTDNAAIAIVANAGTVNLAKTSSGTVRACNDVTVAGGTVKLGGSGGNQIRRQAIITVNSGTFDMYGTNDAFDVLSGSGGYVDNTGGVTSTLTLGGQNGSGTYSGIIQNSISTLNLTKNGTGTLTLAGTSTYTGATTVNAGTLFVTGATNSGSAVTVASGGTLAGTGTVAGAITVSSGGTLAPGTGGTTIGTLTTGAVTFSTTSTYSVDLSATGPTHDSISSTGTVTCAGTLTIASLAGVSAEGKVYEIIQATSVTGTFSGMADDAIFTQQSRYFQIDYTGTQVTLTDVACPTSYVWDGGGTDDNWNTALNWSTDLAPSATNSLQFAGSTRLTPNNNYAAATSFGSLTFNSGAGAFTLSGTSITLGGDVTNSSSNLQTITMDMAIAATRTFNAASANITAGGVISGAGGLTKTGTGTLTIISTSTYTGTTTISAGTLQIGDGTTDGDISGSSGITDNAALVFNLGSAKTYGGVISGTGTLTRSGTGILTLSGTNTYTGLTTINGEVKSGANTSVLGTTDAGTVVNSGGTFDLAGWGISTAEPITLNGFGNGGTIPSAFRNTGTSAVNFTGLLTLGSASAIEMYTGAGALTLSNTGTITGEGFDLTIICATSGTMNSILGTGTGGLIKTGTGTFTLSATNTYTGATTVSVGTLKAGVATAAFGSNSAVTIADVASTSLDITGYNNTIGSLSGGGATGGNVILGAEVLTTGGNNTSTTFAGVVSGTGGLTKTGTGIFTLSGTNTYTGATTVSVGTLKAGIITSAFGNLSAVTIADAAGTSLDITDYSNTIGSLSGGGTTGGNVILGTGTLTSGGDNTSTTYAGVISGTGALVKTGTGTFTITNTQTYTGATTISAGTLQIGDGTTDGIIDAASGITDNGALIFNVIGSWTYANVISGTGTLTKSGSGTLTLSATNTYLGATTVSAGTLLVTGSTYSGAVTVQNGGTLGGTGKVNGAVTVEDGGTIQPTLTGTNGGTLTLANATGPAFTSGANLNIRAPTSILDKVWLTAGTAIFDPQYVDLTIDVTGLTGSVTGAVIVKVAKTSGGIANFNFKSVTITGDPDYSAVIHRNAQTITVDLTSTTTDNEAFLPVTAATTAQKCDLYTSKWTVRFDKTAGGAGQYGGIDSISDDLAPSVNQLSSGQNLFYVYYNGETSKSVATGTWTLLESKGTMCHIVRQSVTLSGVPFIIDYTVHGSGKMFVRVKATNSGVGVSGTLRFVTERKVAATMAVATGHATPSLSDYVLLSSSAANQFDILLTPFDLWSATAFYNEASPGGYAGYEKDNWALGAGQTQEWNFMIDFSHKYWNNASNVGKYVAEYRNPDSLGFLRGTPLFEQAWERALNGHWKLDETETSDTAYDNSGLGNGGTVTGGTFTAGKWGNGLTLNGSESVDCGNKTLLNGISTDGFTVMAWIKPTASINGSMIMGKHVGSTGWKLTGSGGKLAMTFDGNSTDIHGALTVSTTGTWSHVAASCQVGGTVKFFINGILDSLCGASGTLVTSNTATVVLGGSFTGVLDDARYYGRYIEDDDIKAIYNRSYRAGEGMTHLRADNGNSVHYYANGGTNNRRFPVIMIDNYWASLVPKAGCVTFNGTTLTEGSDYYANLSTTDRRLTIGLNKVVLTDSTLIYIDDSSAAGSRMVSPIRQMVWGKETTPKNWFWCKNFASSSFGPAGSNQFYFAWKMDAATTSGAAARGGELSRFKSSEISPYFTADTSVDSNLVPTDAVSGGTPLGSYLFVYATGDTLSSTLTSGTPAYTVAESSSVRIVLQLDSRPLYRIGSGGAETASMTTQWTIYPTGQVFRRDNITAWSGAPGKIYSGILQRYKAEATGSFDETNFRGVVYNTGTVNDNVMAFLGLKYASGSESAPWSDMETPTRVPPATGQIVYKETAWGCSPSIETAFYYDYQRDDLDAGTAASYRDAVSKGVQCLKPSSEPEVLGIISAGTIVKNRTGDLNGDGFNESEGAYMIQAANNSVHFRLPANADTSRYYPVFHITNYLSNQKPEYVTCYHPHAMGGTPPDTTVLIEGYDYNIYHNKTSHELVIQIDSVFSDSAIFWISADRTLAVTMSRFEAKGGNACDTIRWRTESEQENLGYFLYRRIKPSFLDSLARAVDSAAGDTVLDNAAQLYKRKTIIRADTGWQVLNSDIIPSMSPGASQGPIEYEQIDKQNVFNDVVYEYKVMAVDYRNRTDEYGPAEARPQGIRPLAFALWNNYPNPFRKVTNIKFDLPVTSKVTLNVYNLQGRLIRRLIKPDRKYLAGYHRVVWDATNDFKEPVATGPYIYHIVTDKKFVKAKVMMLVR